MTLQTRIRLFTRLGEYILQDNADWQDCKERAYRENPWFITEFIELSVKKNCRKFFTRKSPNRLGIGLFCTRLPKSTQKYWDCNGRKHSTGGLSRPTL